MIDQPTLKRLLDYCPETGIFTWRIGRGGTAWAGTKAGALDANGYINIRIHRRLIKAHRLAWLYVHGVWPSCDLDHRNRNKADNRISNLRLASEAQNVANSITRRDNKCGLKGVSKRGDRFCARITKNKRRVHLGWFKTAEAASAAYTAEAQKFFGEFARSNG